MNGPRGWILLTGGGLTPQLMPPHGLIFSFQWNVGWIPDEIYGSQGTRPNHSLISQSFLQHHQRDRDFTHPVRYLVHSSQIFNSNRSELQQASTQTSFRCDVAVFFCPLLMITSTSFHWAVTSWLTQWEVAASRLLRRRQHTPSRGADLQYRGESDLMFTGATGFILDISTSGSVVHWCSIGVDPILCPLAVRVCFCAADVTLPEHCLIRGYHTHLSQGSGFLWVLYISELIWNKSRKLKTISHLLQISFHAVCFLPSSFYRAARRVVWQKASPLGTQSAVSGSSRSRSLSTWMAFILSF